MGADSPCSRASTSGRNASAPKNAANTSPRKAITLGSPRPARSVPAGKSFQVQTSDKAAATATAPKAPADCLCPPTYRRQMPVAAPRAHSPRRTTPCMPWPWPPRPWSDGRSIAPAGKASRGTPRNTQRQPRCSTTRPLNAGPTSAGTTQAVANAAKMRRRSASGYRRPTSTYSATDMPPAPSP